MTETTLIPAFAGRQLRPGDPDYDGARAVWNVLHDKRPALIVHCTTPADVAAAIAHARAHELPIAVRGGGHSLPGLSVVDDGMVIDLRLMNTISIDPDTRRAVVGAGCLLGDLDSAGQEHGLVVPAGVISHTGVAGLTLGGGVGRLMRRFGLTIDSLLSADLVTADGEFITVDETRHSELYWAIRGGGGNFGVVTSFEFQMHELRELVILSAFHPLEQAHDVLELAETTLDGAPDALLWTSFIRKGPNRPWMTAELEGVPGVMSVIEWSGPIDEGVALLTSLQGDLKAPAGSLDVVPFLTMQRAGDVEFGPGLRSYVKATFADRLSPQLVDVLVERGRLLGSPLAQVELLSMGGRIAAIPSDATAFPHRTARWLVNVPASWVSPDDTEAEIRWVRDTFAALEPLGSGGAYSNFMEGDEADNDQLAYGSTLRRLQSVKAMYDPANIFRLNQNIQPVAG